MEIADFKVDYYLLTIDIVLVSNETKVGFIRLTPRWQKIAKLLNVALTDIDGKDYSSYKLMSVEVVDTFWNNYLQNTVLFRIRFAREKQ